MRTGRTASGLLTRRPRAGAAAPWLLFALSAFLLCIALAVTVSQLGSAKQELQTAADAAALAGVQAFVDDDLLGPDPAPLPRQMDATRAEAVRYAGENQVLGQRVHL